MISFRNPHIWIRYLAYVSLTAFWASLFLDAFELERPFSQSTNGFRILLLGWGSWHISWWANPLDLFSLFCFFDERAEHGILTALISLVLSSPVTLMFLPAVYVAYPYVENYPGEFDYVMGYVDIATFGTGYFLWFFAIATLTIALILKVRNES